MPEEWTDKQERNYTHIVDSENDKGRSTKRAKEIVAGRTVNKERAQKGADQQGFPDFDERYVLLQAGAASDRGQVAPRGAQRSSSTTTRDNEESRAARR